MAFFEKDAIICSKLECYVIKCSEHLMFKNVSVIDLYSPLENDFNI